MCQTERLMCLCATSPQTRKKNPQQPRFGLVNLKITADLSVKLAAVAPLSKPCHLFMCDFSGPLSVKPLTSHCGPQFACGSRLGCGGATNTLRYLVWQLFLVAESLTALYVSLSVARQYQHKIPLSCHDRSVKPSKYLNFVTVWVCR